MTIHTACAKTLMITPGEDLAGRLEAAPAGACVTLAAGRHVLFRPVSRQAALTITAAPGATLELDSRLTFAADGRLDGLEILVTGVAAGLRAEAGTLELVGCTVTGREGAREALRVQGLAIARLTDAVVSGFAAAGISVKGQARLESRDGRFHGNAGPGLAFDDQSTGELRDNLIERNGQAGIRIQGQATPELEGNIVLDNQGPGLHYLESAAGGAYGNLIEGNHRQGVLLEGESRPTLEHNTLRRNVGGLRYAEASGGHCRENACDGNLGHDFLLAPGAQPLLIANRAVVERENGRTGAIRRAI